jgi:hypothetical protein
MDESTLLVTLYSIVAGLGISKLLEGVGYMIEARGRLRFYWMHTAWLVIIFMAHVTSWFALMRFARGAHWTVFNATMALCMPVLLFLVSRLAVPTVGEDGNVDLREYYYRNCRWFATLMIGFVALGSAVQVAVEHRIDVSQGGPLRLIAVIALIGGVSSRRPAVHALQTIALLAVGIAGAALISMKLM